MPRYMISLFEEALARCFDRSLCNSRIRVEGLTYNKKIANVLENPLLKLIELLLARAAKVAYNVLTCRCTTDTRAPSDIGHARRRDSELNAFVIGRIADRH